MRLPFSLQPNPQVTLRRWAAMLSSLDFFLHSEVIQGTWDPELSIVSGSTISLEKIVVADFSLNTRTKLCYIDCEVWATIATASAAYFSFSLPFPAKYGQRPFATSVYTGSATEDGSCITNAAGSKIADVYRNGAASWATGANRLFRVSGLYRTVNG